MLSGLCAHPDGRWPLLLQGSLSREKQGPWNAAATSPFHLWKKMPPSLYMLTQCVCYGEYMWMFFFFLVVILIGTVYAIVGVSKTSYTCSKSVSGRSKKKKENKNSPFWHHVIVNIWLLSLPGAKRHLMYGRGQHQVSKYIYKVPNWKLILQDY